MEKQIFETGKSYGKGQEVETTESVHSIGTDTKHCQFHCQSISYSTCRSDAHAQLILGHILSCGQVSAPGTIFTKEERISQKEFQLMLR